jgi:hypothetical protein
MFGCLGTWVLGHAVGSPHAVGSSHAVGCCQRLLDVLEAWMLSLVDDIMARVPI